MKKTLWFPRSKRKYFSILGVKPRFNVCLLGPSVSCVSVLQVEEALTELFSVRCPESLTRIPRAAYTQDFEEGHGLSTGSRHKDRQPFCGHVSSRQPWHLYRQLDEESVFDIFIFNMVIWLLCEMIASWRQYM